jgi:hypothetical protein
MNSGGARPGRAEPDLAPRGLTRRSLPALVAGILVGAAILTPLLGSAAAFLTKKKADRRYLGNTSIVTSTSTVLPGSPASLSVSCPPGLQATSGGVDSPTTIGPVFSMDFVIVAETRPIVTGTRATGWIVEVFTGSDGGPYTVTVHSVCSP